jgi:hypothetical protein
MLRFEIDVEQMRNREYSEKYLVRVAKSFARLTSFQAKEEIQQKFDLKRPWAQKGMRYALLDSSPSEATSVVFHKDSFMRKHRGETLAGNLATLTEFAQARYHGRNRRPRALLNRKNVFRDEEGNIFQREKDTKRRLFFFSSTHKYVDRLNLLEIASRVSRSQ